ncbi:cadherin-5 [Elysia marginata]|uniref:Cadherin-5 n=1 Tax=Elysia marginata TaxID=1093978 RepID=A0AAV4IHL7_9GAST|nr:cadherin-5 [Elysia marginata]
MNGWYNKRIVLQFIEMYKSLPALWQVKCKDYPNRMKKELAYKKMIEFCKKFNPAADKQFVMSKIHNLRSSFKKELRKVKQSKLAAADSESEDVYEPHLWYYPYLYFIEDQYADSSKVPGVDLPELDDELPFSLNEEPASPEPPSESSFQLLDLKDQKTEEPTPVELFSKSSSFAQKASPQSSPCSDEASHQDHFRDSHQSQSLSQDLLTGAYPLSSRSAFSASSRDVIPGKSKVAKRPRKRKHDDQDVPHHTSWLPVEHPTLSPSPDENDLFGKTIALLLKNTPKEQNIYARKLMYEVMAEAELGNLSRLSYVVAVPEPTASKQTSHTETNDSVSG